MCIVGLQDAQTFQCSRSQLQIHHKLLLFQNNWEWRRQFSNSSSTFRAHSGTRIQYRFLLFPRCNDTIQATFLQLDGTYQIRFLIPGTVWSHSENKWFQTDWFQSSIIFLCFLNGTQQLQEQSHCNSSTERFSKYYLIQVLWILIMFRPDYEFRGTLMSWQHVPFQQHYK